MKILVLNGPNLNLLGAREPQIYGTQTLTSCLESLAAQYRNAGHNITFAQSNCEGSLIDLLQQAHRDGIDGVVFNAGGYTHTSVALRDCIAAVDIPVIEVHISNIYARESFRHTSLLSAVCRGTITGLGTDVYRLGIEALIGGRK